MGMLMGTVRDIKAARREVLEGPEFPARFIVATHRADGLWWHSSHLRYEDSVIAAGRCDGRYEIRAVPSGRIVATVETRGGMRHVRRIS